MKKPSKVKLIIGITAPQSVDLLNGQLRFFIDQGYNVQLLAPDDPQVAAFCKKEGAHHLPIKIERNISLGKDIRTLLQIVRIFKKEQPDIVNLGTPKVSLLGMIAAYFTKVPIGIYTCHGFRFEHEKGKYRKFLISIEKITAGLSQRILCVSESVAELGIAENIFTRQKVVSIGKGSNNGINLEKFAPDTISYEDKIALRKKYELTNNFIFGFVGRLVDRKGINELYEAFDRVYQKEPNSRLLIVGRPYWDQIKNPDIIDQMNAHPGILMVGLQPSESIPLFLSILDIFILPAWWEGFGNVLIEAAAMGIPIISTDATGCKNAVNDGFNGALVPPLDPEALHDKMMGLLTDEKTRIIYGQNGILWAKNFEPAIIWQGLKELYESLLLESRKKII